MKRISSLILGAALTALPALAFSVPITIDNASAEFTAINGGTNHSGLNTNEIHWGVATNNSNNPDGNNSGLSFDVSSMPLTTTTGTAFDLGELTHFNWEVKSGTAASGATLELSFNITDPNIGAVDPLSFGLHIDETPNSGTCAYLSPNYPCSDKITFPQMSGQQTFTIGGQEYTLFLLGFGSSANDLSNGFITEEFADSSTHLWAKIDVAETSVPAPNVLALFLMALGLLIVGSIVQMRNNHNDA